MGTPRICTKRTQLIVAPLLILAASSSLSAPRHTDALLTPGKVAPVDVERYLDLPAGAPHFSPDGQHLAYVEEGEVWIAPLKPKSKGRTLGKGRSPKWSPDGRTVAVLQDGEPSLWLLPVDGKGTGEPLTRDKLNIASFDWSPDGKAIAVLDSEYGKPGKLLRLEVSTGEVRTLTEFPAHEIPANLTWSPDGNRLAWDAVLEPGTEALRTLGYRTNAEETVRFFDLKESRLSRVLPVGTTQTRNPAWHPNGKTLAFAATPHPFGYQSLFNMATWNIPFGAARYLTKDPMRVTQGVWSPDGQTLYVSAKKNGILPHLYSVSVKDGTLRQLTTGLAWYGRPVISPDGQWMACVVGMPDRPDEIRVIATGGSPIHPITIGSRAKHSIEGLVLGVPELLRWRSVDGLELEGTLLYPPGYGPTRKPVKPLPLIVDIHGGPLRSPPFRFQELDALHYFAANGYLCLSMDYRRSGNYGWKPIQDALDEGNFVGLDPEDILSGVRHLISRGLADPARVGARGWSHGGYLTAWLATQSSAFKAIVSGEGITDLILYEWDSIRDLWMGGTPEEVPESYKRDSPITYAAQAKTPIMLVYGERSFATNHGQGERFRDALKKADVEVKWLVLPGEGHGIARKENRAIYWRRTLEWFDTHLKKP